MKSLILRNRIAYDRWWLQSRIIRGLGLTRNMKGFEAKSLLVFFLSLDPFLFSESDLPVVLCLRVMAIMGWCLGFSNFLFILFYTFQALF